MFLLTPPTLAAPLPSPTSYPITIDLTRHSHAHGAGATISTSAFTLGDPFLLRAEAGYESLLTVGPQPIGGSGSTTDAVSMANAGATVEWAGLARRLPDAVIPQLTLDALYASARKSNLSTHHQAMGGRGTLSLEIPLLLNDDFAEPEGEGHTETGLVLAGAVIAGLPRADKLVGSPDLLNGWVASFGFRFYL